MGGRRGKEKEKEKERTCCCFVDDVVVVCLGAEMERSISETRDQSDEIEIERQ
jgi:hypothetical protein